MKAISKETGEEMPYFKTKNLNNQVVYMVPVGKQFYTAKEFHSKFTINTHPPYPETPNKK